MSWRPTSTTRRVGPGHVPATAPRSEPVIRISVVHSFYSSRTPSGENGAVRREVRALRRAGHAVNVVAMDNDVEFERRAYRLRAAARVMSGRGHSPLAAIRRFRPDVVHCHNLFPNFGRGWVGSLDVPLVTTLHNFRPLCAPGTFFRDGRPCLDCLSGSQFNGVRHGCHLGSRLATVPLAVWNARGPTRDPVLREAARIVVLSDRMKSLYTTAGVAADRMVVWPNFLPDELRPPVNDTAATREGWLVVARLEPEKGVCELVDAWQGIQETLTVVGDGSQADRLRALAQDRSVRVLGACPSGQVAQLMRSARGLIVPSRWFEGFPLVYVEALAAGLPVLAIQPNSVADLVRADGTGRAFASLQELVDHIRAAPPPTAADEAAFGHVCAAAIESTYSEQRFVQRAIGLYQQVSAAARSGDLQP